MKGLHGFHGMSVACQTRFRRGFCVLFLFFLVCADSQLMSESMFTTTWLDWQRAWCEAELTPRQWRQNSVRKRGYFSAYLKRTCGNPVWVKALLKHGTIPGPLVVDSFGGACRQSDFARRPGSLVPRGCRV